MIKTLFWSIVAVTWLTVGMHVIKEFIRFNRRKDNRTKYKKTKSIQKNGDVFCKWMEKSYGCEIQPT